MGSRKHRWPGDDTPLTGAHGGTAAKALRAFQEAKLRRRAEKAIRAVIARDSGGKEIGTFKRKDRLRPKARKESPMIPVPPPSARSPWACRIGPRFVHGRRRTGARMLRTLKETTRQRFLLYIAQNGICGLCGDKMIGVPYDFSLDHVIPRALNAVDGLGNLILCHEPCNVRKQNDTPTGCEMVMLLAVNARLGVEPTRF